MGWPSIWCCSLMSPDFLWFVARQCRSLWTPLSGQWWRWWVAGRVVRDNNTAQTKLTRSGRREQWWPKKNYGRPPDELLKWRMHDGQRTAAAADVTAGGIARERTTNDRAYTSVRWQQWTGVYEARANGYCVNLSSTGSQYRKKTRKSQVTRRSRQANTG